MKHYAGIDVSLNSCSVCVVDESGKIVREVKVASEPVALIHCIKSLGVRVERIGLEAGPLSQWLYGALREAGWRSSFSRRATVGSAVGDAGQRRIAMTRAEWRS